jgi:hypothetical protein
MDSQRYVVDSIARFFRESSLHQQGGERAA